MMGQIARYTRKGLTLIEMLIVVTLIAILAALVIPTFSSASDEARATYAVSTMKVLVGALERYHAEHDAWPADSSPGTIPSELEPYLLGTDFDNDINGGVWDYENWIGRGVTMNDGRRIGIALTIRDGENADYLAIDQKIDDGDLSSGNIQYGSFYSPCLLYLVRAD